MATPDVVFALNALAADFYVAQFAGSPAEAYTRKRGISAETAARWRLGYAPPGNALSRHLTAAGYPEGVLLEASFRPRRKEGEKAAGGDLFRNRLMFPILDRDNIRVIAFGSRRLSNDDNDGPKYFNSYGTPVFSKSETLYGFPNLAEPDSAEEIFVVEGNIDMIALWAAGIRNVVATCGTAVTPEHLFLMAEVAERITLVMDSDDAGQKATRKSLLFDGASALDLGVLPVPPAADGSKQDPDDFVRSGRQAWDALRAEGRLDRWEWLWRDARAPHETTLANDVEARVAFKDAWAKLVREHAADQGEGESLLARAEGELGLPAGLLAREYLGSLESVANHEATADELLLVALAAHWDDRVAAAPLLPLAKPAAAVRDTWLAAGAPHPGARLRHMVSTQSEAAERAWAAALRGPVANGVRVRIAALTREALTANDPGLLANAQVEIEGLRRLLAPAEEATPSR